MISLVKKVIYNKFKIIMLDDQYQILPYLKAIISCTRHPAIGVEEVASLEYMALPQQHAQIVTEVIKL